MKTRNWEEYTLGPNPAGSDHPHVTLNTRCVILLNKKVHADIGSPEFASLLYDRDNQTIGILPASNPARRPFPIKKYRKGAHLIYAKPFCRHYDIIPPSHVRFLDPRIDHDGILCLDLNAVAPVTPKKRGSNIKAKE